MGACIWTKDLQKELTRAMSYKVLIGEIICTRHIDCNAGYLFNVV
jgi:hypothetical protein